MITLLKAKKALVQKGGGINMPLFKSIMNILMPVDPLDIKKAVGLGFPAGGGINMPLFKSIMQILMPVDPLGIKKAVGLGFPSNAPPSYESMFPGNSGVAPPPYEYENRGAPPTYIPTPVVLTSTPPYVWTTNRRLCAMFSRPFLCTVYLLSNNFTVLFLRTLYL